MMMSPVRVLIVEDNPGDARLIQEALAGDESQTFHVTHAAHLGEGCALVGSEQFGVILLDLSLPDSHGLETLSRVRAAAPAVPIVVLTGLDDDTVAIRALGQGAQDFLVKGHANRADIRKAIAYAIERQQLQQRLSEVRKLEAVGRLAGALAHEYNNLMQIVLGNCEFLRSGLENDATMTELVREIQQAGRRGSAISAQMLAAGGLKRVIPAAMSLNDAVRGAESRVGQRAGAHIDVAFVVHAAPDDVRFDPLEVAHVLDILTANAVEAMPDGGRLAIETGNLALPDAAAVPLALRPGPHVTLTVIDSGVGMSEDVRARLFEPFFKTKGQDLGTGLSLAGVFGTLRACGAGMSVVSEPGRGAAFTIYFPHAGSEVA